MEVVHDSLKWLPNLIYLPTIVTMRCYLQWLRVAYRNVNTVVYTLIQVPPSASFSSTLSLTYTHFTDKRFVNVIRRHQRKPRWVYSSMTSAYMSEHVMHTTKCLSRYLWLLKYVMVQVVYVCGICVCNLL